VTVGISVLYTAATKLTLKIYVYVVYLVSKRCGEAWEGGEKILKNDWHMNSCEENVLQWWPEELDLLYLLKNKTESWLAYKISLQEKEKNNNKETPNTG